MGLKIKTLNGVQKVHRAPNGGWGWVVVFGAFNNMGLGFGFPKTLGVFFNEMKNELGVSNAAISWLLTAIMSVVTFTGLLVEILKRWLDERQIVMLGGFLSCVGMVTCSYAPNIFVFYFGGIVTGLGCGMASLTWFSQLVLYFSTYTALANAIALSGSTLFGVVAPYLAQFLMDQYTWRGALLVQGAISLNASACGALLRPISVDKEPTESLELQGERKSHVKPMEQRGKSFGFCSKYWLCLCFLFTNFLDAIAMYVPNVYVVPFALELNLTETQSVALLSAISIGDFVGRLSPGVVISKLAFLNNYLLHLLCAFFWTLSAIQLVPAFLSDFAVLVVYCFTYGLTFGAVSTLCFTVLARYIPSNRTATAFSWFFASGGSGLLISGALSGAVVDFTGTFVSVFWLTAIVMGMAATSCTIFSAITIIVRGHNMVKQP